MEKRGVSLKNLHSFPPWCLKHNLKMKPHEDAGERMIKLVQAIEPLRASLMVLLFFSKGIRTGSCLSNKEVAKEVPITVVWRDLKEVMHKKQRGRVGEKASCYCCFLGHSWLDTLDNLTLLDDTLNADSRAERKCAPIFPCRYIEFKMRS